MTHQEIDYSRLHDVLHDHVYEGDDLAVDIEVEALDVTARVTGPDVDSIIESLRGIGSDDYLDKLRDHLEGL